MNVKEYVRAQWDRVLAGVLAGAGLLVLLLGWVGVSSTPYATEQVPYVLSGGVLAILLLGAGGTMWLSADLRDEWRKLDQLDDTLLSLLELAAQQSAHEPLQPPAQRAEPTRTVRRKRQEPAA